MPSHESEQLSERESFENGYFYFVKALKVLCLPAEVQCEWMDDLDVAWHLKNDVSAARYLLLSQSSSRLSSSQRAAVESLITELENVPVKDLPAGFGRDSNLRAMNHPSWTSLRVLAAELIEVLAPATEENDRYFASISTN